LQCKLTVHGAQQALGLVVGEPVLVGQMFQPGVGSRAGIEARNAKVQQSTSVFGISLVHNGLPACHIRETYGQGLCFRTLPVFSMNLR
jgi:hypothetical protein